MAKENLFLGIVGGLIGAIFGAAVWGGIIAFTGWQISIFAVLVGFLTGFGVKYLGNGTTATYGLVGAVLALLGCVLGDVLAVALIESKQHEIDLMGVLGDTDRLFELMKEGFKWLDLVFYAIAVYCGYTFSIKASASSSTEE